MTEKEEKETYVSILGKVPVFSALDREKLLELYDRCALRHCTEDEVLMVENTPAEEIYIVLKGEVKILLDREGEPLEITRMGEGHCIGETSVIGIQNHSATVVSSCDSTFLVLSRKELFKLYEDAPKIFGILILNIARELARRLKKTDSYLEDYRKHCDELVTGR